MHRIQGRGQKGPRQRGFSLLEALIALVIIMIGLLGVAGLQALGVRSGAQAHLRTLASLDAHSLAASMRANRAFWAGPAAPTSKVTIQADASGSGYTISPTMTTGQCAQTVCTATEMAGYDLGQWGSQLALMQHGAKATITRITAAGTSASAYMVRVVWNEQRMKGQGVETPTAATHHTVVVVQP